MYVIFLVYIVCVHFAEYRAEQSIRIRKQVGPNAADYIGCYQDSKEKRILPGHSSYLTDNTPVKCSDICFRKGFRFAGVQAVYYCFCGNAKPTTGCTTGCSGCTMRCPQDNNLWCGGDLLSDVYRTGLTEVSVEDPTESPELLTEEDITEEPYTAEDATEGPSAGEYLGCYEDSYAERILSGHSSFLIDNTPTKCINICLTKGFRFAGVQDAYYCFCGNNIPATSKTSSYNCLNRCPNGYSYCGGYLASDVYRTGVTEQSLGCYRDSEYQRILPGHYSFLTYNSPSKCIELCTDKGFELAGLQNTYYCYCGNDVPTTKVLDRYCDMPCPEYSWLKCGGYLANNVYQTGLTISTTATIPTTTTTSPTTMSTQEAVCIGIMDWKYMNVVLKNENTCQYQCINKYNKKVISIFKTDGEFCNNGKGICIRDLCHDISRKSGCPESFHGARKICKMHCHNVLKYPGISIVMNVKDGDICINKDDYHGTCSKGKCSISLEGEKNTTSGT